MMQGAEKHAQCLTSPLKHAGVRKTDSAKNERTWNRQINIEHKEARGTSQSFQRSYILFVSFRLGPFLRLCPSFLLLLALLAPSFFLPPKDEKHWKSICTLEWIKLAGAWEESDGNPGLSLSLCLYGSLSHSWGVFTVFVLETCEHASVCMHRFGCER